MYIVYDNSEIVYFYKFQNSINMSIDTIFVSLCYDKTNIINLNMNSVVL